MTEDGYTRAGNCRLCKMQRTDEDHDPCIANLPGVLYACCGHGIEPAYIKFEDGRVLRFTPLEMDLDIPEFEAVNLPDPVPVFVGSHNAFNYKEKKKKVLEDGRNIPIRGMSRVILRQREVGPR